MLLISFEVGYCADRQHVIEPLEVERALAATWPAPIGRLPCDHVARTAFP